MFNKVIMVGNLTRDPELRFTPQGTAVANMRLAVNSRVKVNDEFRDETLFIDVVVFGRQAETTAQYLSKGRGVLVEGRLRERRWEYEGQQRSKMEIIADRVRFLPRRAEREDTVIEEGPIEDIEPPEEETDLEPF